MIDPEVDFVFQINTFLVLIHSYKFFQFFVANFILHFYSFFGGNSFAVDVCGRRHLK
jgi:hypothetical protein